MDENELYIKSMNQIAILRKKFSDENFDIENTLNTSLETSSKEITSNLDAYDVIFAILFGGIGAFISTNQEISEFCDKIHKIASDSSVQDVNSIQKFLGNLLKHKNDPIDIAPGYNNFINRNGENAYSLFHRLLFGHDIFSFSKDNPIILMCKNNGIILGILKTFRHLIADTFSKQGLPIPIHSKLDYIKTNGKTSNYLILIAQELAKESKNGVRADEVYSHMFTIKAQDIAASGLVFALAQAYLRFRNIENSIRKVQYRLLVYSINFFSHSIIGAIRQGGIPYINFPALSLVIKTLISLYSESNKRTKELEAITNKLIEENELLIKQGDELEKRVYKTGSFLKSKNNAEEYVQEYAKEYECFENLIDFFEVE